MNTSKKNTPALRRDRARRAQRERAAKAAAHPRFRKTIAFDGIGTAAAALGVSKFWLRSVLRGEKRSKTLVEDCRKRYPELVPPETQRLYGIDPTTTP